MNMKKVTVLLCVAWMGAGAFALSFLGPPTSELEMTAAEKVKYPYKQIVNNHRENNLGYIFSYSEMDIDVSGVTLEDVELTRHYLTWGIALDQNFSLNVLLGTASGEVDSDVASVSDFEGDNDFSWGFNLKSTFSHGEKVDWGAMVQMTWFSTKDTVNAQGIGSVDLDLNNAYDLQVAVGPTVDMGGWKLYGGGYYYMLDADLDADVSIPAYGLSGSASLDVEEEDNFGGFIGAIFNLNENTDLGVEYQMGNDSSNLGLTLGMRF